jgi:hypothetical protein
MDRERPSAGAPARRRRWDWVLAAGPGAALVVVVAATLAWAPWIPPAAPAATSPSIDEPGDERLGGHLERVRSGMAAWVDDPAVPDPSRVRPCPDASSALDRTYTDDPAPTGINAAGGTLSGCAWTDDAAGVLDSRDRIEVSLRAEPRFSKDTLMRRLGVVTKRDGCEWASVFSERPYAALMVCETTRQRVWTLAVPDDDGSGAWLITTAVGADVQWGFSTGAEVTTDLWGLVSGLDGEDVPSAPAPGAGSQVPRMDREFVELVEALAARPQPASMGGSGGRSCLNASGALTSALDVGLYAVAEPGDTPSDPLCWWTVGTPPTNDAEFARTLSFTVAVDGTADHASHRAYVDTGAQEIIGPGGPGRPDRCLSSDLPLSEVRTSVLACSLDGQVRWSVVAASPDQKELWVLDVDVPARSGADPSTVVLALVDVADEIW